MKDLIKREDAIEELADYMYEIALLKADGRLDTMEHYLNRAKAMLKRIPSADRPRGEWIPCSERLPEEKKGVYLICTEDGYICSCRWTNVNPFWADLTTEWHWCEFDIPQYNEAVAWMELKPWKGADDERDS